MHRTLVSYSTPGVRQVIPRLNGIGPQIHRDTQFDYLVSDGIQGIIFLRGKSDASVEGTGLAGGLWGLWGCKREEESTWVWHIEKRSVRWLCLSEGGTGNPNSGRSREIVVKEFHLNH